MYLSNLFDMGKLEDEINNRFVIRRLHPTLPYAILHYSDRAVYSRHWNPVTENCRGLVYDRNTLKIVARPWKKFWNSGEQGVLIDSDSLVEVTDKMDGSLGVLCAEPQDHWGSRKKYFITTKGSFDSEQGAHATKIWRERYENLVDYDAMVSHTFLFEIVYPENRIVLDYGDMDDLVLLGCVGISFGSYYGPQEAAAMLQWPGPVTQTLGKMPLSEVLQLNDRPNAEGIVARSGNKMVKVKQPDYLELHKIKSELCVKSVWEALRNGNNAESICANLPDEFHGFVKDTSSMLMDHFDIILGEAHGQFENCWAKFVADGRQRKTFALEAVKVGLHTGLLFAMLDEREYDTMIWDRVLDRVKG